MVIRAFTVYFFCSLFPLFTVAVQIARGEQPRLMPEEQALAALHAKSPDAQFAVVRTVDPESDASAALMQSLREARAQHPDQFEDSGESNLLQVGGYLVLELAPPSGTVTKLDYVTLDSAGKPLIGTEEIEGKMSKEQALQLFQRHEDFLEAFFETPSSEMKSLLLRFGGSGVAAHTGGGEHGCMTIPESIAKLPVRLDEEVDLISLACSVQLWPVRLFLTIPMSAIFNDGAQQYMDGLGKDLEKARLRDSEMADFKEAMNLDSITTPDQLHTRIKRLRKFDAYLEKYFFPHQKSAAYQANLPALTLPLGLGASDEGERTYYMGTFPGLITMWSRGGDGDLVLTGLSMASD
jgi:hypothetical protein